MFIRMLGNLQIDRFSYPIENAMQCDEKEMKEKIGNEEKKKGK